MLSRLALAAVLPALALCACDQPKPRHVAPAPPAATSEGVPPPAAWAAPLIGRGRAELFPGELKPCLGNTDVITRRYAGEPAGVMVVGWGWDPAAKAAPPRVILVDIDNRIAGGGESGLPRPDVPAAIAEVTSPDTGWSANVARAKGPLDAFGIVDGGQALCRLGHIEF